MVWQWRAIFVKGKVHLQWISGLAAPIKEELLFINRMNEVKESLDLTVVHSGFPGSHKLRTRSTPC